MSSSAAATARNGPPQALTAAEANDASIRTPPAPVWIASADDLILFFDTLSCGGVYWNGITILESKQRCEDFVCWYERCDWGIAHGWTRYENLRVTRFLSKDEFVCYEYLMKRYMVIWPPPRPVSVFDSLWKSIARFFGSLAESFSLSSDSSSASEFANVNYERVAADTGDQEIQLHEFDTTVAANRATVALSPARSSPTAASLTASLPPS